MPDIQSLSESLKTPKNLNGAQVVRVLNVSGSAILGGRICKLGTVFNNIPSISLANSSTDGAGKRYVVVPVDIPNGEEGWAFTSGMISMDTTGITAGVGFNTSGVPVAATSNTVGSFVSTGFIWFDGVVSASGGPKVIGTYDYEDTTPVAEATVSFASTSGPLRIIWECSNDTAAINSFVSLEPNGLTTNLSGQFLIGAGAGASALAVANGTILQSNNHIRQQSGVLTATRTQQGWLFIGQSTHITNLNAINTGNVSWTYWNNDAALTSISLLTTAGSVSTEAPRKWMVRVEEI